MTNQQMVKSYHLRFQLNGIPEPLYYAVDQAESEWLQHLLQAPEHRSWPFFFFTTSDGYKVMVSLPDIQLVTFGWDVGLTDVGEPPVPKIEIYFRGTAQPYQAILEDPGPLETIFLASTPNPKIEAKIGHLLCRLTLNIPSNLKGQLKVKGVRGLTNIQKVISKTSNMTG